MWVWRGRVGDDVEVEEADADQYVRLKRRREREAYRAPGM